MKCRKLIIMTAIQTFIVSSHQHLKIGISYFCYLNYERFRLYQLRVIYASVIQRHVNIIYPIL